MELNEIKEYLESNKDTDEVKDLRKSLTPEIDVNQFMEREDVKKKLQSSIDAEASRQVETFKTNTLPDMIKKGISEKEEAAKTKTPEQLKFEEYETKLSEMDSLLKSEKLGKVRETNKNKALKILSEKKLPTTIVELFIDEDEEVTLENVAAFTTMMNEYTAAVKQAVIKSGNIDAADSDNEAADDSGLTSAQRMQKQFDSLNSK